MSFFPEALMSATDRGPPWLSWRAPRVSGDPYHFGDVGGDGYCCRMGTAQLASEAPIPRRIPAGKSLAEVAPAVAAELDLERSGGRTAAQIHAGSHDVVGWRCPKGPDHKWDARVAHRTRRNVRCPFCAGRRASVTNDLNNYPEVAAQFDVEANGGLTPADVPSGSEKPYHWRCDAGPDHRWEATPAARTQASTGRHGTGCPFCTRKIKASVTNSLARFPELAAEFDVEANGCTPDQVVSTSQKRYWWRCERGLDHQWQASPYNRAHIGSGCRACAGLQPSVTNDLNNFPEVAAQLDPELNDGLTPDQVVAGSNTPRVWRCDRGPDHIWSVPPVARTAAGTGCPACAGKQASVTNNLARYPDLAAELDPDLNDGLTADDIVAGAEAPRRWRCRNDPSHVFEQTPANRTRHGQGCTRCSMAGRSIQEVLIAFEVCAFVPFDVDAHRVRAGGRSWRIDLILSDLELLVEFDSSYWHAGEHKQDIDARKAELLRASGWRVVRLREAPLTALHSDDIVVPFFDPKAAAVALLEWIAATYELEWDDFESYKTTRALVNEAAARAYLSGVPLAAKSTTWKRAALTSSQPLGRLSRGRSRGRPGPLDAQLPGLA
jgi:hypothetical protein